MTIINLIARIKPVWYQKRMSRVLAISIIAVSLVCTSAHAQFVKAGGKYTPCIDRPVFQTSLIDKPEIEKPKIDKPLLELPDLDKTLVDKPDFKKHLADLPDIVQPEFDSCKETTRDKFKAKITTLSEARTLTTAQSKKLDSNQEALEKGGFVVARPQPSPTSCCGGPTPTPTRQ